MLNFSLYMINESLADSIQELDEFLFNSLNQGVYAKYKFEDQGFWQDVFLPKCAEFLMKFGFNEYPECGRHRCTFINKNRNVVIKVPSCELGMASNEDEYNSRNDIQHANCKLLFLNKTRIPIIIMEKLNIDHPYKDLPDWANTYDCCQVGSNKSGKFKAYDYSRY